MPVSPIQSISSNEAYVLEMLRSLKPFEQLILTADKQGKVGQFLLIRSSKVILSDKEPLYTS